MQNNNSNLTATCQLDLTSEDVREAMISGDDATALEKVEEAKVVLDHPVERREQDTNLSLELEKFLEGVSG